MKKIFLLFIIILIFFSVLIFYNEKNNNFKKMKYYKKENNNRYIQYKRNNKNKSDANIILEVNMNLDKKEYTIINTINYINQTTLLNKYNKLNNEIKPKCLKIINKKYTNKKIMINCMAVNNIYTMFNDMKKFNLEPIITSGYRTKEYQEQLYSNYKIRDKKCDMYSARPRHSEHELGLAIDIIRKNGSLNSFKNTKEYMWLKYNSYKYGFILRYPKNKEYITKYIEEPWHFRYIGEKHAKKIHKLNLTYEEYYEMYINN